MTEIDQKIENTPDTCRHIVLLGAGASKAAFPNGDANGYALPLMNDLVKVLELESILARNEVTCAGKNFERIFSELQFSGLKPDLVQIIEEKISNYFKKLSLPNCPTIYDHLVLSLRPKDLIATFNWDPLLSMAYSRNSGKVDLPHVAFLHGNVGIGFCLNDNMMGCVGHFCKECGTKLTPSILLYPATHKNYRDDPQIVGQWQAVENRLSRAYIFTVFGYSAPKTDAEAIELLKQAWGPITNRQHQEIEIIDI